MIFCPVRASLPLFSRAIGQKPYYRLSNEDAIQAISNGTKLVKPDGCNPEL